MDPRSSGILVVGIPGSLREGSHTRMVVDLALEGAAEVGARVEAIDLRQLRLPFVEEDGAEESAPVQQLRARVRAAQGIVLGTPEYHGSFSGVLKNALDLMGFEEFEGKMLGLVGVSGGALGATAALNELRGVGRTLHAWVVPEQAGVPAAHRAFTADGRLEDARLAERVREVGRQVARFAYLHSSSQWQDFLQEWQAAPSNPGAESR